MKYQITDTYKSRKDEFVDIVSNFNAYNNFVNDGQRNSIKKVAIEGLLLNIKAFKVPNFFNQIIYKYFRKSKAQRSYTFGQKLLQLGVLTPEPIAYFEFSNGLLFGKSYYLSEQIEYDLTFRELLHDLDYDNHEEILRAFTRFTFMLHENEVEFLDHSPGNTLIKKVNGDYAFYLVDLNRMVFKPLNFKMRMKNFARLSASEPMIKIMSDEYATCYEKKYDEVLKLMTFYSKEFVQKSDRKKRLKKKLKFWKD